MEQPNRRNVLKGLVGASAAALGATGAEAHLNPYERLVPFPKEEMKRDLDTLVQLEAQRESAEKGGETEEAANLAHQIKQLEKEIAKLSKKWLENSAE